MDADESVNEELNISQISFSSWHYSTPMKDRGTTSPLSITRASLRSSTKKKSPYVVTQVQKAAHVRKTKQKATFKVPEVFYKCPHCPKKKYKTQRYYNEHMLVHKVQDACARFPSMEELLLGSTVISERAFNTVSLAPCFGEAGQLYSTLIQDLKSGLQSDNWIDFSKLVCEHFASSLRSKKYHLPSALWTSIFSSIESVLANKKYRDSLVDILACLMTTPNEAVIQVFICDYILEYGKEVLTFIKESIIPQPTTSRRTFISFDQEDRTNFHNVGGHICHKYLKRCEQGKKHIEWQKISIVIRNKMIVTEDNGVEPCSEEDAAWTKDIDRGGLNIIGKKFMNVIMSTAALLSTLTEPDGTLLLEKVLEGVHTSHVPVLWDDMVGSEELSESLSLEFMSGVVKSFAQTFGRGLLKMHINLIFDKPHASVNLRHAVAKKK